MNIILIKDSYDFSFIHGIVVTEKDFVCRQKTDADGFAKLGVADTGFYLVICSATADDDIRFSPFLISLPQMINDEMICHVVSSPKFESSHTDLQDSRTVLLRHWLF